MNIEEAIKEVKNYLDYDGSISITAIATLYTAYKKQTKKIEQLEKENKRLQILAQPLIEAEKDVLKRILKRILKRGGE